MTEGIVWTDSVLLEPTGPWPPELQSSVKNAYLAIILCMWLDHHDRIRPHAKYKRRRERPDSCPKKNKTAFIILGTPRQLGAHKMTKTSATSGSFPLILCMWSDPIMIRPHVQSISARTVGKPFGKEENDA
jgi:hypothetical protein